MKLIITRKYETFTVCFTLLENPSVDSLEKSMQRHRFESDLIFVFFSSVIFLRNNKPCQMFSVAAMH